MLLRLKQEPRRRTAAVDGAHHIGVVSDPEIAEAMWLYFTATHNLAEGAGAVGLALALQEHVDLAGLKVGLILTGGSIDRDQYAQVLIGGVPSV